MRIGTSAGPSLDLRIAGYEFSRLGMAVLSVVPLVDATDDDANWLVVEGVASDGERAWEFREPCLQTWDVDRLAGWFDAAAIDDPVEPIEFLEPVLTFERIDGAVRVRFELEGRPPWRPHDGDDWEEDWGEVWIDAAADPTTSDERHRTFAPIWPGSRHGASRHTRIAAHPRPAPEALPDHDRPQDRDPAVQPGDVVE